MVEDDLTVSCTQCGDKTFRRSIRSRPWSIASTMDPKAVAVKCRLRSMRVYSAATLSIL